MNKELYRDDYVLIKGNITNPLTKQIQNKFLKQLEL